MTAPKYNGLQKDEIPAKSVDNGNVTIQAISGNWDGVQGAFQSLTDVHLARIDFNAGGKYSISIEPGKTVLLYIVRGAVKVNGETTAKHHLVEFNNEGKVIELKAMEDAIILLGYATPFREPFVAYGPFVMNTKEEIMQAYDDYNNGRFGNGELK